MTGLTIRQVVVRKSNTNNTYINNTDINKSNQINPVDEEDVMEGTPAYMELIRENINYDEYMEYLCDKDKELYEDLLSFVFVI